jgi:hypothetical protein
MRQTWEFNSSATAVQGYYKLLWPGTAPHIKVATLCVKDFGKVLIFRPGRLNSHNSYIVFSIVFAMAPYGVVFQLLLAAPVEHRVGFGTCGPKARSCTSATRTSLDPRLNPTFDPACSSTGPTGWAQSARSCGHRSAHNQHGRLTDRPLRQNLGRLPGQQIKTRRSHALHGFAPRG